jgi:hypothetical protein
MDPVDARRPAQVPLHGQQAGQTHVKPWWEAAPAPDSERVIAERFKAMFDSAHDPAGAEE